ncbi:MAG: hypothetical protein J5746_06650 [Victivallales bacterium]|nr:hypothetical protein [Victivallales bacterium]
MFARKAFFILTVVLFIVSTSCYTPSAMSQYNFRGAVQGQASLREESGIIYITVRFPPANVADKQIRRKMDRKRSEHLLNETLRHHFKVEHEIKYAGLQQTKAPVYGDMLVEFEYKLPRNSIVIK